MKTCQSSHQRPYDSLWVHCALPPLHPDSHLAKYVNQAGSPCWMRWKDRP